MTGSTNSADFPTQNPYQAGPVAFYEAFVTKLSPSGNGLVYSTYLSGDGGDIGSGLAVDAQGHAYVTGTTSSTDFPTQSPFQTDQPGQDAFVTRLSTLGNGLVYSTYLGGATPTPATASWWTAPGTPTSWATPPPWISRPTIPSSWTRA